MFDFGVAAFASAYQKAIDEKRRRKLLLANMTPEERRATEAEWEAERQSELAYRRALAIADAGRARNFWGQ